ncbi:ER lumen protein retaining receptor-domain-containing protein [Entophlyctis helioformis]|nr:ER lumen protein retaining receptor-domain-containing protein [Entophlyctis helioformis]
MAINVFQYAGDMLHLVSIVILLLKIYTSRSAAGISFKTQALYATVFLSRYLDLFMTRTLYLIVMKLFFISSSLVVLYLMKIRYKASWDPALDTFRVEFLIAGAAVLGLLFHPGSWDNIREIFWSFSIFLESVAILPQLFQLSRTSEAETITSHYLFALGGYRLMYIPNWIYKYSYDPKFHDWISVVAGLVQTTLYIDFFYVYFTKVLKGKKFRLPA